jgi:hypothetical protein
MEDNSHREVRVHIDEHPHHSPNPTTGAALYTLGEVHHGFELFKEVEGNREDTPIPKDETPVHLREDEHFHSAEAKHHKEPLVEFEDVNAVETVDFRTPWDTKLNAAWDKAVVLLEEPRKPTDRLQTPEGTDLMPYLGLTMHELKERKIITALKFQIVGPTGGA